MGAPPWHLEKSYLASGWYQSDTYSAVLPDLRQPRSGCQFRARTPKDLRPRSATERRVQDCDATILSRCRLHPQPTCKQRKPEGAEGPFFGGVFRDDRQFREVLTATPELERLRLANHYWLSPELLTELGPQLPQLQELNLRGTHATDVTLATFVTKCPQLCTLDVSGCNLSNLECVAKLPKLREFRAARCPLAVTPSFVGSLQAATELELLDLSFCPGVNGEALGELSKGCRMLFWLELVNCPELSDAGLLALARVNPGIQHLSVALNPDSITDMGAARVVRCLKRARSLDFSGCTPCHLYLPISIARYCEYLEDASFASIIEFRDDDLRALLTRCVYLRRLNITGCVAVTEEAIIDNMPYAQRLEKLMLSLVPGVSDAGLKQLRTEYPRCLFEQHVREMADPNDLTSVLGKVVVRPEKPRRKTNHKAKR